MASDLAQLTDSYLPDNPVGGLPVERLNVYRGEAPALSEFNTGVGTKVDDILNKLTGANGQERYQLWPEKVIRGGLTAAGDALAGNVPQWAVDKDTGDVHTSPQMIEKAQEISALAGTGGLAGGAEGAALNATPSLRPALRYKDKLYKGQPGQQHLDVIPKDLYPEFEKMAMSGEDLAHYNFGFMNHKGQFLDREKALEYAVNEGLLSHYDANYGALTSTMKINKPSQTDLDKAALLLTPYQMQAYKDIAAGKDGLTTQLLADSSKPGTAIEAMGKTAPKIKLEKEGTGRFYLKDEAGNELGRLATDYNKGSLHIINVNTKDGANSFGPTAMRDVLHQLLEHYPEANEIAGFRTAGARANNGNKGELVELKLGDK